MQLSLKNDNDKYEIGGKIRERRTALGLSQDELADMVGTDGNSISRHENGTREMKISQFCQLVDTAAGLSEGDLEILLLMARRMKMQAS